MENHSPKKNLPFITVAIPTYNSARTLQLCLEAVRKLDYSPKKMRIVFVDNNSSDETPKILEGFQKRFRRNYENVIIVTKRSNIPEARNLCIKNSVGEYLLFIDSDVLPPPDTVKRMLEIFASNPKVRIVGFPYKCDPMTLPEKMYFSKQKKVPHVAMVIGMGCTMIKRELFNEIGLFTPEYHADEDAELTVRTSQAGYMAILDPTRTPPHLTEERLYGTLQEIVGYCVYSFKPLARYHFMILSKYNSRWMINKVIFYLAMAVSIPLAVVGVILSNLFLILPLIACYGVAFAYHFPKASGKWRIINSILYPLFGMFFALGIFREIIRYRLLGKRET